MMTSLYYLEQMTDKVVKSKIVERGRVVHHHFHRAEPPISQRNMNGTVVPLPFGELELNSSTGRGPRQVKGGAYSTTIV